MTLSYRWGGHSPVRTTRRTIQKHVDGLELDELPNLFQDAIKVTRALGIRYLWIDALCIIQDDRQDWEEQAISIGDIYQHSFATIAPHSAASCREGFLWRFLVPSELDTSSSPGLPEGQPLLRLEIPALSDYAIRKGYLDGQLRRRAWIVKEMCMSKRTLHFIEDRILWECPHSPSLYNTAVGIITPGHIFRDKAGSLSQRWLKLVKEYSGCNLTVASDKLPAVAGVAKVWP